MGGRKAWEAAGRDTVVKVDGFSRADPNSRLVWEMIPGNRNSMQVNETAEKALAGNSPPTRPARLYLTLDVTFVVRERQRGLVT